MNKIWVVQEYLLLGEENNKKWEDNNEGYYSSREIAENALRKFLKESAEYSDEEINFAFENRIEDPDGFMIEFPEDEYYHATRYDVSCWDIDTPFSE